MSPYIPRAAQQRELEKQQTRRLATYCNAIYNWPDPVYGPLRLIPSAEKVLKMYQAKLLAEANEAVKAQEAAEAQKVQETENLVTSADSLK